MVSAVTRKRFTAAQYHRMVQAGILHEDDRVELVEGEIVQMSPIGRRHAACVNRLNRLFSLKAPLYARAGILEMGFVDLGKNCVEVYRQPSENGYRQMESFEGNQTLFLHEIADFPVPVSAVIRSSN